MARVAIVTADPTTPAAADLALETEIEADGHTVTFTDDNDAAILDTTDYDVIVLGAVAGATYVDRDRLSKCGVIIRFSAANAGAEAFDMCTAGVSEASMTQIDVDSPLHNHPMWGGEVTTGLQTVTTSVAFATFIESARAAGVKALAQAGSTAEHCIAIAEKGHLDANSDEFQGRRVFLGILNNATAQNTLGYDILRAAVRWAANENAAATERSVTVGSGGTYSTFAAMIAAEIDGVDLSTVVAGGRQLTITGLNSFDERVILHAADLNGAYTDEDCYIDFDFSGHENDFSGSMLASDNIMDVTGLPFVRYRNLDITFSGTFTGSGGSGSCCKSESASFTKFDRIRVRGVVQTQATNIAGISANAGIGQEVTNCWVDTIDCTSSGQDVRGIRTLTGGSAAWPTKVLGCSVSNIANSSTAPVNVQGIGHFHDGSTGDSLVTRGNAVAAVNGSCFVFNKPNGGTIVSSHNASTDATADDNGDNLSTHLVSQTGSAMFASPTGTVDLHQPASGRVLDGVGVDLSGESANMAHDFDGESRTAPHDIGADHFVATGAGPLIAGLRNHLVRTA